MESSKKLFALEFPLENFLLLSNFYLGQGDFRIFWKVP
jgi:hypothetical protein